MPFLHRSRKRLHGSNIEYRQLNCAEARKNAPRPAPNPLPISMPYTDRRIGWHLDLAHRDALIEAYKKRYPAPVILLVSVNLSNSSGIQERKSCVTMWETGNTQIKHWRWNWCGDCLHVLMRVWMIRSLNRTLMSIECLHHCQINALCSWTALQTVGRCRSSQKHSWSDYDAWKVNFCAAVSISGEKKNYNKECLSKL